LPARASRWRGSRSCTTCWNAANWSSCSAGAFACRQLERGELVELFGGRLRLPTTATYYLIQLPLVPPRPELTGFVEWVRAEAARTRRALGEPA